MDTKAGKTALKKLSIQDRFKFADQEILFSAEHGKFHSAPIHLNNSSVLPAITWIAVNLPTQEVNQVPADQAPEETTVTDSVAPRHVKATDAECTQQVHWWSRAIFDANCGKERNHLIYQTKSKYYQVERGPGRDPS